jgi:hypothetical protein
MKRLSRLRKGINSLPEKRIYLLLGYILSNSNRKELK